MGVTCTDDKNQLKKVLLRKSFITVSLLEAEHMEIFF